MIWNFVQELFWCFEPLTWFLGVMPLTISLCCCTQTEKKVGTLFFLARQWLKFLSYLSEWNLIEEKSLKTFSNRDQNCMKIVHVFALCLSHASTQWQIQSTMGDWQNFWNLTSYHFPPVYALKNVQKYFKGGGGRVKKCSKLITFFALTSQNLLKNVIYSLFFPLRGMPPPPLDLPLLPKLHKGKKIQNNLHCILADSASDYANVFEIISTKILNEYQ